MPSSVAGVTHTLLLIDGHSMAFRAFFALPAENFTTSGGVNTNAVYGFTAMLLKLIETEKPTHIAVAFDLPGGTFRTEQYSEYKAGRDATPEEFKGQIALIQEVLDGMGIRYLTKENYEADDILATLAHQGDNAGWRVVVASGDRDSFQMVTDNVTVIYPGQSTSDLRFMTPKAVEDKYGVTPARYPELAALVGESADNLPGVPGVGPKTAAQWLAKFDGLTNLLEHADQVTGKRGEALRDNMDAVRRNRELNHLLTDLDLEVTISDLQRDPVKRSAINTLFDTLEFNTLRKRVFSIDAPAVTTSAVTARMDGAMADTAPGDGPRTGASVFGSAHYGSELPDLPAPAQEEEAPGGPVPLRELTILPLDEAALAGLDVAAGEGAVIAVRVGDAGAGLLGSGGDLLVLAHNTHAYWVDMAAMPPALDVALRDFLSRIRPVVHDGKTDWHRLHALGFTPAIPRFDTQLAAYLLQPDQRNATIGGLVETYLGHVDWTADSEEDEALFSVALNAEDCGPIGRKLAAQAGVLLDLRPVMRTALHEAHQDSLLDDMELPVQRTLALMENRGIAIDTQRLDELAAELQRDVESAQETAWQITGQQVNLSSPKQLQALLFDTLNLPKTKKTKTGYTTNAEALAALFEKTRHPFLEQLLIHRDRIKLKQMVETLRSAVREDGRIHSTFSQVVASTGRLASSDPNLQNIPTRTEDGRRIRHAFVAGPHYEALLSADYSQIEMRIMAHLSEDAGLIEAFTSGEDLHSTMASMIFGVPVEEVTPEQRSRTKATSYGLAYGLSPYGLSQQLSISVPEASALRDRYFERFGGVQRYLHDVVAQARKCGYTSTMFGRRRYLPDLNSPTRQLREIAERAALNAPIQGSAADIVKIAMIRVEKELAARELRSRMLLQIHDELLIELAPGERDEVEEIVTREMSGAVHMSLPLDVAVGVGHSWREAAH